MAAPDAILDELCKAAESLGGDARRIRALPRARIYRALEDLGADHHLLAVVGSWGECMDDVDVLELLQAWNLRDALWFDRLTASPSAT